MPTMKQLPAWLGGQSRRVYTNVMQKDQEESDRLVHRDIDQSDEETHQHLLNKIRHLKRWLIALSCLLALAAAAVLLSLDTTYRTLHRHNIGLPSSPLPPIPTTQTTFSPNTTFQAGLSPSSDQAWKSLFPPGDGFILLPNTTRDSLHLPPGKPAARGDVYDISVFHQMHCLLSIRSFLYQMIEVLGREDADEVFEVLLQPKKPHLGHCFDYLRQALMCAGDVTAEWPRTEKDGRRFAVDGWGITHRCRDWDAIMEWMRENDITSFEG